MIVHCLVRQIVPCPMSHGYFVIISCWKTFNFATQKYQHSSIASLKTFRSGRKQIHQERKWHACRILDTNNNVVVVFGQNVHDQDRGINSYDQAQDNI